jgi:hypothetical protein
VCRCGAVEKFNSQIITLREREREREREKERERERETEKDGERTLLISPQEVEDDGNLVEQVRH